MKIILAGGGNAKQSTKVDNFYKQLISDQGISLVHQAATLSGICSIKEAIDWLKNREYLAKNIISTYEKKSNDEIDNSIFFSGGNTFTLKNFLNTNLNFFESIKRDIYENNVVYGCSAGAIILGKNISTAEVGLESDENIYDIQEFSGFNTIKNHLVHTHFNYDNDKKQIEELSFRQKDSIICIKEESGCFWDGEKLTNIGDGDIFICNDSGSWRVIKEDESFLL